MDRDELADDRLRDLALQVRAAALRARLTVATAESCTGGLIAHLLTEIPGSSDYLRGGVVAYSNDVKERVLDVPGDVLAAHGAVSAQVGKAMARGALDRLGADVAVSATGVAGPSGGSDAKPVGLTYVAVADEAGSEVRRFLWTGDRSENKRASARAALELLLARLEAAPSFSTADPDAETVAAGGDR